MSKVAGHSYYEQRRYDFCLLWLVSHLCELWLVSSCSTIMSNVFMSNVFMSNVFMSNVFMTTVVMTNTVAPLSLHHALVSVDLNVWCTVLKKNDTAVWQSKGFRCSKPKEARKLWVRILDKNLFTELRQTFKSGVNVIRDSWFNTKQILFRDCFFRIADT